VSIAPARLEGRPSFMDGLQTLPRLYLREPPQLAHGRSELMAPT
jgi:hypothetical protein